VVSNQAKGEQGANVPSGFLKSLESFSIDAATAGLEPGLDSTGVGNPKVIPGHQLEIHALRLICMYTSSTSRTQATRSVR
jgi:hypothetical protein